MIDDKVKTKTKLWVLSEAWWKGANSRLFNTKHDAKNALIEAWEYAQDSVSKDHIEECYMTGVSALVSTDEVDDMWYGVIKEVEV